MAIIRRNTHFLVPLIAAFIASFKRMVSDGGAGGAVSGTSAAGGTGSVTGSSANTATALAARFAAPAAAGVNVHAAIASDNAAAVTTGMTNPAIPRSVQVVFHASWDGGDVTVVGTDQFDQAVTETIADNPGNTVQGTKIFKTVTSINQETVGAGGTAVATVQTGTKLGLLTAMNGAGFGLATVDGAADAATFDATYSGVTFTSAPNGSKNYVVVYNANHLHAAGTLAGPSHTHGAGSYAGAPASSAVHYDRGEYTVTVANATSLATSLALCKALVTAYATHRTDTEAHDAADTTNTVAASADSVVDLASAITAANQLKTAYNAHRSQSGVHPNNDSGNAVSSSNATDQSSLNTLLNEIKTDLNAHLADGMATPSWRVIDS